MVRADAALEAICGFSGASAFVLGAMPAFSRAHPTFRRKFVGERRTDQRGQIADHGTTPPACCAASAGGRRCGSRDTHCGPPHEALSRVQANALRRASDGNVERVGACEEAASGKRGLLLSVGPLRGPQAATAGILQAKHCAEPFCHILRSTIPQDAICD